MSEFNDQYESFAGFQQCQKTTVSKEEEKFPNKLTAFSKEKFLKHFQKKTF